MAMTYFPPDAELDRLAKKVNRSAPEGTRIDLCRIAHEDGRTETSIVFSCGPLRARQVVREIPDERDLVQALRKWSAKAQSHNRWTPDPNEASV